MEDNVKQHERLCKVLNAIYSSKNRDYGNSFHKTYVEEGMAMPRIRLSDKFERFKKLSRSFGEDAMVKDETLVDTLLDMANYCLMTVMEIENKEDNKND